jgi:hypothetical protein
MMWTPFQLEIIIHHHCSGAPFERSEAPAYRETVEGLEALGLLEKDVRGMPTTTEKGRALVKVWCNTPVPIQKWVDPRFDHDAALKD